jgi:hypothetical protein
VPGTDDQSGSSNALDFDSDDMSWAGGTPARGPKSKEDHVLYRRRVDRKYRHNLRGDIVRLRVCG